MGLEYIAGDEVGEIIPEVGDVFEWKNYENTYLCIMTDEDAFVTLDDGCLIEELERLNAHNEKVIRILPKGSMFKVI